MRALLVGVSCVGKTTIGPILARRLGCSSFDFDAEVEKHFETSIERLKARLFTEHSYRLECSVVLERIVATHPDCVIAMPPSGLRDAYLRVLRKFRSLAVVIEDTPENILERLTFYDIDSKPIEKQLTVEEKRRYLREIKKEATYFRASYRRAALRADIAGLDPEAAAQMIQTLLAGHPKASSSS
jgi:shikimate kinase